MPPTESLSHSAVRDPIQSVLVQRFSDVAVVTTRVAKSIGVDKKMDSRGHLLEVSVTVKNYPTDAVLVAYYRFKDIQNRGKIHVNPTGHSTVVRESEPLPNDPAADPAYLNRNVFAAGSFSFIQDEDLNPWKSNTARVTAFFRTARGVLTMENGSMVFPLHARGVLEDGEKAAWDLDATEQELSFLVQYANNGVFSVGEKLLGRGGRMRDRLASMNNKPAYFFYFNNTKENKDNKKLKLANTVLKFNLPAQIDVVTLERVDSVRRRFLLRLRNTAEYNDVFAMYDNEVTVDLTAILNSMGLKAAAWSGDHD